jgi:quinolinate synthase
VSQALLDRLAELKKERNAVILAHNYQRGEVQDAADYVGDSLGLSQQAAATDAEVILFCGVDFMAETAAILCPEKTVLIPDPNAGCPMADMVTGRQLREFKAQYPDAVVICYVNSSAAVKAESDLCCTSANGVKVVESVPQDKQIIFVPDKSLGAYCAKVTGRDVILWPGYCPTHHRILSETINKAKADHPDAIVVIHPECLDEAVALGDYVGSTTGILNYCRESDAREFIIGTESGIIHRLKKENPGKDFYPASPLADCPNMKLNTLEKMVWSLEDMQTHITVDEATRLKALTCIERMLEIV